MVLQLVGYFDASGHPAQGEFLTVGGYIGDVRSWTRFDKNWDEILRRVGLKEFHMADFMRDPQWDGKREDILTQLIRPIRRNARKSVATLIYLDDWREVNQVYDLRRCRCTPYALCGLQTMVKAMAFLQRKKRNAKVAFIFEDGDADKGHFIWMMDELIRMNKAMFKGLKPIFLDKSYTPLQAADFVMWEQAKIAKMFSASGRKPIQARHTFSELVKIPHEWGVMKKEDIISFCVEFDVPKVGEGRAWTPLSRLQAL